MADETVTIDGHRIKLKDRDKLLFPDEGISKGDLIDYYRRIAPVALPHYRNRPLSMRRYPDGIGTSGFFQKDAPDYFPDWIERATMKKKDGTVEHVLVNSTATLVYLANQACITPHIGLARTDRPHHPDRMIIDLDPSDDDFSKVQAAMRQVKRLLDRIGMPAFVQTSGSRGLHVVVPLDRSEDFEKVREFATQLARWLAREKPDLLTVEQRKDKRGDKVFLDVLRNAYGQTAVAPYAVRARPGAPVATPLRWREAGASRLQPRSYTVKNIFRRLSRLEDPWSDIGRHGCALESARQRFERFASD